MILSTKKEGREGRKGLRKENGEKKEMDGRGNGRKGEEGFGGEKIGKPCLGLPQGRRQDSLGLG